MTLAGDLAGFLAPLGCDDLPPRATEYAAMLIASTLASAACGREIVSTRIVRALARERGGTPQASLWFDRGAKLPAAETAQVNAVMSDAAASDDPEERDLIMSLLGHRDELMERIRTRVLREDPNMPPKPQEALFTATMLFERVVWLARKCAVLLSPEPAEARKEFTANSAA